MEFLDFGYFSKRHGNIFWLGLKDNPQLITLQKQLHSLLEVKGFTLDDREFNPHITIGRKVEFPKDLDLSENKKALPTKPISVKSIELMKSEQVEGKLTYTLIYSKSFL